jgi:hypothetical protein
VAFGSSLLGLAGSLVVGLLELFAGHGQNRFYQELEDWLSSITRVGFTAGDDASNEQQMVAGVVDHMAEQMEQLRQLFAQSDVSRALVDEKMGKLADAVDRMTTRIEGKDPSSQALMQVAAGQDRLIDVIEANATTEGIDAESRMRLRSIDVQMLRILEEISAGRQETMAELRHDISLLAKALSGPRRTEAARQRPADQTGGGTR